MNGKRYDSILDTIGGTPVVRINHLAPEGANLFVKIEAFNPMGSVKDRLALGVIEDAERRGALKPGQTVIEATSGNTGIALAMVCAQKGYPLVVTMSENFSLERRKMMRFLGARVVLTPASEKGSGMLAKAVELAEKHGWFLCRQFENEANAEAHARTTAPEILADFADLPLDYWVSGFGTGGTLKGVARVLKKESPHTQIVVCEPDNSQTLGSGIPQSRDAQGRHAGSHPNFRPHLMQGWSPDFIPRLMEDVMDLDLVDRILPVAGADALRLSRELARREGIFVGISAGATFAGALQVCAEAEPGATVLCMLPDTGERYLSTPLFEDIPEDMTDEETEISRSTPNYRFDISAAPPPATDDDGEAEEDGGPTWPINDEARKFLANALSDPDHPVVLFALEWCEFSWSVRKMFAHFEIPYRSVDLDSVAYQQNDRGGAIRGALLEHTGSPTIPKIFVGGELIGGCTELFDAYREGELQNRLEASQVGYRSELNIDPYTFFPGWLHSRPA
ncbi:MAG: cysteine synthase A [Gammaproteobacteria bacterium]|jgi:cysteine synthase A|nr:cysteine synthase A [Gammaproteobacteria bacterium]